MNNLPEWPTREQWAAEQRALYHDRFEDLKVKFTLTEEEVRRVLPALRELRNAQSRRLRVLKIPAAWRQPSESLKAHYARIKGMPQTEQDLWQAQAETRWMMDAINKATRALKEGAAADLGRIHNKKVKEVLAPIVTRYQAAEEAARKKREQEILATPIDDARGHRNLSAGQGLFTGGHSGWSVSDG